MNMVVNPASVDQLHFVFTCDTAHIWQQPTLQLGRDQRTTLLCAEDAVHELAHIRVRHPLFNRPYGTHVSYRLFPPMNRRAIFMASPPGTKKLSLPKHRQHPIRNQEPTGDVDRG